VCLHRVRDCLSELRPVFECVTVARTQLATTAGNVGKRAEPVVLYFKEPGWVIEGLWQADEGHGSECWGHHSSVPD
jgi:hypothetical protein